nr:AN1-type zinc finger domain-containing protein [Halegenticoccus soli]
MGACKRCGEKIAGDRACSYCGNAYCPEHQLPENHDCPGVEQWNRESSPFHSDFDDRE